MREGWEEKMLKEIGVAQTGTTPKTVDKENYGDFIPFIKPADIDINEEGEIRYDNDGLSEKGLRTGRKMSKDSILMVCIGATIGKVGFVDRDVSCNQQINALTVRKEFCAKFFYYALSTANFFEQVMQNSAQATLPIINKSKWECLTVKFPKSLPEQQRIVAILDEAFASIAKAKANAEQNLNNAKELFESYLQSVFENKGEGWEEKCLEDLADEKCTLSYGIVQPGEEYNNGLPIIRPTDLTTRFIGLNGLKRINPKLADGYKRTKLIGDELLLCVRGSTGVVSIALKELEGGNVTRGIVPIRFNSKIINQEFGYYLLVSNYIQKQIKAKTYGAALMQINIGDLRKILTPYPSLKQQQTIVRNLDALSTETKKLETIYQQKINDLEELKKSVLQKAFNGELTGKAVVAV